MVSDQGIVYQVAFTYWRHMANTFELIDCNGSHISGSATMGGDESCCQFTLGNLVAVITGQAKQPSVAWFNYLECKVQRMIQIVASIGRPKN